MAGFDDEPAHGVVPLLGQPTGARLHEAIQRAIVGAGARLRVASGARSHGARPVRHSVPMNGLCP